MVNYFPYIFISDHEYPRIERHRGAKNRPGKYYGPFASSLAVNMAIKTIQKIFLLRSCTDKQVEAGNKTCFNYFKEEIDLLKNVKTIIALGKIAFDACIQFYKENYFLKNKDYIFGHGVKYVLPDKKILVGCYHPSPRNVNTGRIDEKKMTSLFKKILKLT